MDNTCARLRVTRLVAAICLVFLPATGGADASPIYPARNPRLFTTLTVNARNTRRPAPTPVSDSIQPSPKPGGGPFQIMAALMFVAFGSLLTFLMKLRMCRRFAPSSTARQRFQPGKYVIR